MKKIISWVPPGGFVGWLPQRRGGHSPSSHHTDDCTANHCNPPTLPFKGNYTVNCPSKGGQCSVNVAFAPASPPLLNDSCGEGTFIPINIIFTTITFIPITQSPFSSLQREQMSIYAI